MNQEEASTSGENTEREGDCVEAEEDEPEALEANQSVTSSNSSIEDAESFARRLQEFEDENVEVFRNLFLQIHSIAENLSNTIREISMEIVEQNAWKQKTFHQKLE